MAVSLRGKRGGIADCEKSQNCMFYTHMINGQRTCTSMYMSNLTIVHNTTIVRMDENVCQVSSTHTLCTLLHPEVLH